MKYLLLVLISLFYLSSFSDHKKNPNPVTEEERIRYDELNKIYDRRYIGKEIEDTEERKEFDQLYDKIAEDDRRVHSHFNKYILMEFFLSQSEKNHNYFQKILSVDLQISHFSEFFKKFINQSIKVPDCTKEKLEKNECPKPPHQAIYWAKRALWEGKCVKYQASRLNIAVGKYAIPKTDIRGHESLFFIFRYIATYFEIQSEIFFMFLNTGPSKEMAKKELKKGFLSREDYERYYGKKRDQRKKMEKQRLEKYLEKIRNTLNEKEKVMADKMINDLIQKWSKKYGKDEIYTCRYNRPKLAVDLELKRAFLEEYYPHFD